MSHGTQRANPGNVFAAPLGGFADAVQRKASRAVATHAADPLFVLRECLAFLADGVNLTPHANERAWELRKQIAATLRDNGAWGTPKPVGAV